MADTPDSQQQNNPGSNAGAASAANNGANPGGADTVENEKSIEIEIKTPAPKIVVPAAPQPGLSQTPARSNQPPGAAPKIPLKVPPRLPASARAGNTAANPGNGAAAASTGIDAAQGQSGAIKFGLVENNDLSLASSADETTKPNFSNSAAGEGDNKTVALEKGFAPDRASALPQPGLMQNKMPPGSRSANNKNAQSPGALGQQAMSAAGGGGTDATPLSMPAALPGNRASAKDNKPWDADRLRKRAAETKAMPPPERTAGAPQGKLKANQAGKALKLILARGGQPSDLAKAGAGYVVIDLLWGSFMEPWPGWLWAIPLLDLYIIIGFFKKNNAFFQQLAKWKKILVMAVSGLIFALLAGLIFALIIAVIAYYCTGITGGIIKVAHAISGYFPYCTYFDKLKPGDL
jgi:hypothetical protein